MLEVIRDVLKYVVSSLENVVKMTITEKYSGLLLPAPQRNDTN